VRTGDDGYRLGHSQSPINALSPSVGLEVSARVFAFPRCRSAVVGTRASVISITRRSAVDTNARHGV
jgi:hypothetical protein